MCGIIAVLRRKARRQPPTRSLIEQPLRWALGLDISPDADGLQDSLAEAAQALASIDNLLKGPPGIHFLRDAGEWAAEMDSELAEFEGKLEDLEFQLDKGSMSFSSTELENLNAGIITLHDKIWAIRRDRLPTAKEVLRLAGPKAGEAAIAAFDSVQTALSALDRLEVRGRDSAGLHILVTGHGLDLESPELRELASGRVADELFGNRALRISEGSICFVYKRAAEIGDLGDNVAALRRAISGDELLHLALQSADAEATVLGHTRWASVGIISEANAHPLNQEESAQHSAPYAVAALNGDVDNFVKLSEEHDLSFHEEITTDAKVIPSLVSRRLAAGDEITSAFRQVVASFEGSVAIGMSTAGAPDQLQFALRGSGQALYLGLSEDSFVVASEPYGVIEVCDRYLRMDGETPGNPRNEAGSRGQIVSITREHAGELEGIARYAYDGSELSLSEEELVSPDITTRDVDRGTFSHYLLKEITESPRSFRKTLRGRIREDDGHLHVLLGNETLPQTLCQKLQAGTIRRILVIGQGTAAVAGTGVQAAIAKSLIDTDISVQALPATELSGFQMRPDMSDSLVVAISQSGTTTDTNRTVDLVRSRGAIVVAIVNRRASDLTDKADGVLYTSDGRDVEMSVASTKAFYAQIAAGFLLASALAHELGCADEEREREVLSALRDIPAAMERGIAKRPEIAKAARSFACGRRYWAVVGNGLNRIAAQEIRIKLSELCYKSISCDATEDKKHIDLSCEPLILVCAAGLTGSTADDVAKEIAIYRAHRALPVVIASEGENRFDKACQVISMPVVHPDLAFILSALGGHLFGYEAALAIDALAKPLRLARAAIEDLVHLHHSGEELFNALAPKLVEQAAAFYKDLRAGDHDGQLEARTAVELSSQLRYACGLSPLANYQLEHGKVGTPAVVIDDLTETLTQAIEELTRPVDAIKHQAKTVTVGISRSDEALLHIPLVAEVLGTGASRELLSYDDLKTLAALDPMVEEIQGFSRYAIIGGAENGSIEQVKAGGVAAGIPSRTKGNKALKGTKHLVARERKVFVARGRNDGRTVILVPEVIGAESKGVTLLHVRFRDRMSAADLRSALSGYRNRYSALQDAVTETEPELRSEVLESLSVVELLTEPIHVLADHWRH